MRLEHHLVGGYVRYISPHIIIIIISHPTECNRSKYVRYKNYYRITLLNNLIRQQGIRKEPGKSLTVCFIMSHIMKFDEY